MKTALIRIILRDRSRALTLLSGLIVGVVTWGITKLFGAELTGEQNAFLVSSVTLVVGWIVEAVASSANAAGAEAVQTMIKESHPDLEVDRYIGPETIEAARQSLSDPDT